MIIGGDKKSIPYQWSFPFLLHFDRKKMGDGSFFFGRFMVISWEWMMFLMKVTCGLKKTW